MVGALASRAAALAPPLGPLGRNDRYRALGLSESPNYPLELRDIRPIPAGSGGGAQLGTRTPESSCRSGEPPGFRMVKDWDLEGFTLLTSWKPIALEENGRFALCFKASALRQGTDQSVKAAPAQ